MRLDESTFIKVHDSFHNVSTSNQTFPVVLPFVTDKAIITVTAPEATKNWYTAGYLKQYWSDAFSSVLISRTKLPLSQTFLVTLEPVNNCILRFEPVEWIGSFYLTVEVRTL